MSIKLSLRILYQLTYHATNQILYLEILIYLITYIQIEKYIFYHSCLQELEQESERQEIFQIEMIYKKLYWSLLLFYIIFISYK